MKTGVLFVSRYTKLLPWYKVILEETGYQDVYVTDKDKDGLNMLIREMKPRLVFITSNFYSIGTPYMVGVLHKLFPRLVIAVASMDYFPDELATWFIFHGAQSYVNFLDGFEEFKTGLKKILYGNKYVAPTIKHIIEELDEIPDCNLSITKRQKEILLMLCNGFSKEKMQHDLHISGYTVHFHIKKLMSTFHVHSREELIKASICLDIVNKNHLYFHDNKKVLETLPDWAKVQIEFNRKLY